ncbi:unnamed protein product, partial [Mesorhabditis belari]|uniref:Cation efflux protein cytoplasmic domain-containing protein n=1 Tax=Mesorhabditis belari TaxID=2138241 RepID=A0AAF3EAI0_9BILA
MNTSMLSSLQSHVTPGLLTASFQGTTHNLFLLIHFIKEATLRNSSIIVFTKLLREDDLKGMCARYGIRLKPEQLVVKENFIDLNGTTFGSSHFFIDDISLWENVYEISPSTLLNSIFGLCSRGIAASPSCWNMSSADEIDQDDLGITMEPIAPGFKQHLSNSCDGNDKEELLADDNGVPKRPIESKPPTLRSISLPQGSSSYAEKPPLHNTSDKENIGNYPVDPNDPPSEVKIVKKNSKRISDYYKKQNELLEGFQRDTESIMLFQRNRSRFASQTSQDPREEIPKELINSANDLMEIRAPLLKQNTADEDLESYRVELLKGRDDINSEEVDRIKKKHDAQREKDEDSSRAAGRLALATLAINISLMIAKAIASWLSGSLSILSSLADSIVDITSGLVIFITTRAIKKRDPYLYPTGRTRLEPIALIIISTVMGIASIMLIWESISRIYKKSVDLEVDWISAGIMLATIATKFTLMCICKQFPNEPSINVLAMDHRNDCLSNAVAILCAGLASYLGDLEPLWLYVDPLGAMVVSIYIAYTWYSTGKEHLSMLSGRSAEPGFINRIIKVCIDHDPRIEAIDTVYVYHWGTRFLVEVHIVLDPKMRLKVAHDISESLQLNIESLPDVERAFVHTDYEYTHQPEDEHKTL